MYTIGHTNHTNMATQTSKRKHDNEPTITAINDFFDSIVNRMKDTATRTCYKDGCDKVRLGYGYPGEDKISCNKHFEEIEGLVAQGGKCILKGCDTKGRHKVRGTKFGLCAPHRDELIEQGLPDVAVKREGSYHRECQETGCTVSATFDDKTYCEKHSVTGVSDDKRECEINGCKKKRPTFGFDGKPKTRCFEHKEEGMVSHKLCIVQECTTSASYGEHGGVATHCNAHRPHEYVLNLATCAADGCTRQPSFGPEGGVIYTHCSSHKMEGHVDLRNKRCVHNGCDKNRSFGLANGGRLWCFEHKTDDCVNLVETKCYMECCVYGDGIQAAFFHPDYMRKESEFYKKRICYFAKRALIEDALLHNDVKKVGQLLDHFKAKKVVTLNAQSAFRFACEKLYFRKLKECVDIVFDEPMQEGIKTLGAKRPDIFYKWCVAGDYFGIHIEYDETRLHEQDDSRLERIAEEAGCQNRVYVVRVQGGHETKYTLCNRVRMVNFEYYRTTDKGKAVAQEVAEAVMQRMEWIKNGLAPDENAGRPYKVCMCQENGCGKLSDGSAAFCVSHVVGKMG